MPLYEYRCEGCGKVVEAIQRFSDPPYTICPHCGGALKKLISAPAIKFKGAGFYINDYAKGGSAGGSESKSKSTSATTTSDSSSSSSGSSSEPSSGSSSGTSSKSSSGTGSTS